MLFENNVATSPLPPPKEKITGVVSHLSSPKLPFLYNEHLPLSPRWPLWSGLTVFFGKNIYLIHKGSTKIYFLSLAIMYATANGVVPRMYHSVHAS